MTDTQSTITEHDKTKLSIDAEGTGVSLADLLQAMPGDLNLRNAPLKVRLFNETWGEAHTAELDLVFIEDGQVVLQGFPRDHYDQEQDEIEDQEQDEFEDLED